MQQVARVVRQQYIGVTALFLVLGDFAYAVSGQAVLLGRPNIADKSTTTQNTGTGAALDPKAKAGQPPLKVNSNKLISKLNADLLDGKNSSAFAAAGSSYTKAESDGKYLDGTEAYTKTQVDAGFLSATAGDARYGRVLMASEYAGNTPATQNVTSAAFTQTVAVPAKGNLMILLWGNASSDTNCGVTPEVDSVVRGGADNSSGSTNVVGVGAAGNVQVNVLVRNHAANAAIVCSGQVTVVFFPTP